MTAPHSATKQSPPPTGAGERAWPLLFAAWCIAVVASLGSLFFSEVMEFAPCALCWYQRVCLFPLVIVLARGLFPLDPGVVRYALPLAAVGWLLAAYHCMIHAGWIPAGMQPCGRGVSCSEEYVALFGFLSIPSLSLLAFSALLATLVILKRETST